MNNVLGWMSWLVTVRPWLTLLVLFMVTVVMVMGTERRLPPTEGASVAFLPPGHPIAEATQELDDRFADAGEVVVVTLLFRGDALSPSGLAQMDRLLDSIVQDPGVAELLAPGDAVVAPSSLIGAVLQVDSFDSVTQQQIDSVRNVPGVGEALAELTGADVDGTPVAIAVVRLRETDDERVDDAERKISELAVGDEGAADVTSLSSAIIEDAYKKATEEGMGPLIGLALLLIAALLLLFTRTLSDMLLTLLGLIVAIMWVVGGEGWLGPDGLGLIGPPSSLTAMVPVILISLTVDYAIQGVSHYREQRLEGQPVVQAVRMGLRNVTVPLVLAAVTTIVSLLATLFSPIGVIGDFGVVAGMGVGMSLIVMLTLLPATRTIIDRRREARGTLRMPRPLSNALPGIPRLAEWLGRRVTRHPAPYLVAVLAVTIVLGFAARGLESEFSIRDILPRDGSVVADMDTLDAAVGGSTEMASVLVKAEASETRTILNLQDLRLAFDDEQSRPRAAAGPLVTSYELLLEDWITRSGQPGDNYDAELAALFSQASAGVELDPALMQEVLERLEARDPAVAHNLVNDPNGIDTILLQFLTFSDDPGATKTLQADIEALWAGDDNAVTVLSESVVSVGVTDAITNRQTEAISTTIAAALTVLAVFFWLAARQPALAVIAVGPIVLVLISVLGTMALLGIPYSLVTSIITALSIGIGVDYTIHVIHRYREEFTRSRNPESAAVRTLATTGSALLGSAMTTALGFGVLIASPLLASQQFGITATITIVYSLIVSVLLVLPAMVVWGAYQNMRLRSMVERQWAELDVAIEAIHQNHESEQAQS
ncbi:MAG: MMPL family transporter [Chloroflexi bacterium]|nr:MMPL family transporter [Chloroflexota bacterium]